PTGGADAGVVISQVSANSPAAAAGLKVGDRITALNGTKVTTMLGMSARVQRYNHLLHGDRPRPHPHRGGAGRHRRVRVPRPARSWGTARATATRHLD